MRSKTRFLILLILVIVCTACNNSKEIQTAHYLQDYVKANKYTPFDLARDSWGVGTIVSFKDGYEDILEFNEECLNLSDYSKITGKGEVRAAAVSLPKASYAINREATFEAHLARAMTHEVDVRGALGDGRVAAIEIELKSPNEKTASNGAIERKIKGLFAAGEDCVQKIVEPDVFVIDRVLLLDGFAYSFLSNNNRALTIDVDILDVIGVDSSMQAQFVGKAEMASV